MIAIIIAFFNADQTLKRAIKSVLNQEYKNWELILVNDGSADQSDKVASQYLDNFRIRYYHQENMGVSSARNLGASEAKGDWLIFLDGDDSLDKYALSCFNKAIQSDGAKMIWLAGVRYIGNLSVQERFTTHGPPPGKLAGSFCVKREAFRAVRGYDEELKYSENTELFYRIDLMDFDVGHIPYITLNYYNSESGGSKNLDNMIDSIQIILKKHSSTLSVNLKHVYHQIVGVIFMRFQNYKAARKELFISWLYKPYNILTLGRLGVASCPPLAKKLYKREIIQK